MRQNRARQREWNFVADLIVFCTTNDLARLSAAVIHLANTQAIRVRVLRRCSDLRDDHLVEFRAALFDSLVFDPRKGEKLGQPFNAGRQLDEFAKPVDGEFHVAVLLSSRAAQTARALSKG